jgi:ubiquitin-activating enzyme E1
LISFVSNDVQSVVTTLDENRHGFEDNVFVTFAEVKGMTEINGKEFQIKVLGPYTFSIGDTSDMSKFSKYITGGVVTEVKKPKKINFKSIKEANEKPEYVISDFVKMDDNDSIHLAFQAYHEFKKQANKAFPKPWDKEDSEIFSRIVDDVNSKLKEPFKDLKKEIIDLFSFVSGGELCPMQSIIGGVTAQEVMKACSGKFSPIMQYFYFDCRESLPEDALNKLTNEMCTSDVNNRYAAQIHVYGQEFQQKLESLNYFLVGAGALGCEYLKIFAMIGIGCSPKGKVVITDMDTIEKSNLNRQFLFRSHDVQKAKSEVASKVAKHMNPNMNIISHLNRVGNETEHVYNDEFFESLDGVCNALDNIDARIYVDRRCVYYRKPLIESGTLGTKGNVQVVVPYITESYSSSQDPPEKSIPICTLKNFPNAIEHTLQWARDTFEGLFTNPAYACQDYLKDRNAYIERVQKLQGSQPLEEIQQLYKALVGERPKSFEECVEWARKHWQDNYHNVIRQLLFNFPPDQLTSSGVPFWSGPKRCPHPLVYDVNNQVHFDYVYAGANLKAEMYGLSQNRDKNAVIEIIKNIQVEEFKPKSGVKIHVNDSELQNSMSISSIEKEQINDLISKLAATSLDIKINPIEFEKDDDNNLHLDFIVAASNLRAENYDITTANRYKVKLR